MVSQVSLKKFE